MEDKSNVIVNSEEISLKELISKANYFIIYLKTKWIFIFFFCLLGGITGFAYAWSKRPVYVAATSFVLDDGGGNGGSLSSIAGLASIAGIDLSNDGGGIFQGDNILELYKSRAMIEKALLTEINYKGKAELLVDRYIDFNGLKKEWSKSPELKNMSFLNIGKEKSSNHCSRLQDSVLGKIVESINSSYLKVAKPDKKLSIIKAEVSSEDEFFAKTFNEQIVKNVNDFYVQTKTKKSLENITILQRKTDSVRTVMNGAIYNVAAVADATPNLNPTRQVQRSAPMQRSQFSVETNKAVLGSLLQNLEMIKMTLLKETPLIQIIDKPVYPLEVNRISKSKAIILGALSAGFLAIFMLLMRKVFKDIIAEQ
ncbi:lipopolysaccharide biosynthesis protein [Pedobacter sp. PWIIR3]